MPIKLGKKKDCLRVPELVGLVFRQVDFAHRSIAEVDVHLMLDEKAGGVGVALLQIVHVHVHVHAAVELQQVQVVLVKVIGARHVVQMRQRVCTTLGGLVSHVRILVVEFIQIVDQIKVVAAVICLVRRIELVYGVGEVVTMMMMIGSLLESEQIDVERLVEQEELGFIADILIVCALVVESGNIDERLRVVYRVVVGIDGCGFSFCLV